MAKTMTEFEVRCHALGWDPATTTQEDFGRVGPKRYPMTDDEWDKLINSPHIYRQCDICRVPICVNNWPDGKSRTPKFKGFIVCVECDPRHIEDRYMKEGYRILHPRRMKRIQYAQVTRGLAKFGCLRALEDGPCNCAGCAAIKLAKDW